MNKLDNNRKLNYLHIAVIAIGAIFISLSIFHTNLWFDESYSVEIAKHSFSEIWSIGSNDVHPILYYFVLHIAGMITNYNIMALRVMSFIPLVILGILGYTHIRKDFGLKTGIIFSFLIFFLPVSAEYAGEIRMYSLGMLLGTIMAIYAYRLYKGQSNIKNFIIFGVSSLLVSYTHYYGLMLAGIINLLLFIYYLRNRKTKNIELRNFVITAVAQILLYLPWIMSFLKQLQGVSKGFWITLSFPETLIEILNMQFVGSLGSTIGLIFALLIFAYLIYIFFNSIRKTNEKIDIKPAMICMGIYISIILIALIISLCMQSVILLYRYLIIITGLFVFAIAFFMSKDNNKYRVIIVCSIIFVISIISNIGLIQENYDNRNNKHIEYMQENIQNSDIILYSDAISGAVVSTYFNNQSYFYDKQHWNVEKAYQAFSNMKIIYDIEELINNYEGRIWLVGEDTTSLCDEIIKMNDSCKLIYKQKYITGYKNNVYTIALIEVN